MLSYIKESHGYTKTLDQYKTEKIQVLKRVTGHEIPECSAGPAMAASHAGMNFGTFGSCDYESFSESAVINQMIA